MTFKEAKVSVLRGQVEALDRLRAHIVELDSPHWYVGEDGSPALFCEKPSLVTLLDVATKALVATSKAYAKASQDYTQPKDAPEDFMHAAKRE